MSDPKTKVGNPISGETFNERYGQGRQDWWYVPVSKLVTKWETTYFTFESKEEAERTIAEHRGSTE